MEVIGQVRDQSFRKKGKVFMDKKDLFILYICQYFNFLFGYIVAGVPKHPTPPQLGGRNRLTAYYILHNMG